MRTLIFVLLCAVLAPALASAATPNIDVARCGGTLDNPVAPGTGVYGCGYVDVGSNLTSVCGEAGVYQNDQAIIAEFLCVP
ncbi:MAG: hypothetical protein ACYDCK_08205 [Thermoplasmatota archaeon]